MTTENDRANRFMQLYAANQRRIFGFVRTMVFTHQDAEDLTQDTVAILWRKFDQFETGTDFGAWAIRIARYEILNQSRRRSVVSAFDPEIIQRLVDHAAELADASDVRRHALHECIKKLPDDHRQLLQWHYDAGHAVRQIADQTGRSQRTIYRTLQQIHDALLQCIRRTITQ